MINIFTICNSGYFIHLQGLLYSFKGLCDLPYKIYIYDIGLNERQRKIIKNSFNFLSIDIIPAIKKYTREDILSYKFKVDLWEQMKEKEGYILFHDSKNHQKFKLSKCIELLENYDILLTSSDCIEKDFTHSKCIDIMECTEYNNTYQLQSGLWMIKNEGIGKELIKYISVYGNIKDCLNPEGSRKNMNSGPETHRQDQSIFSLLVKKLKMNILICEFATFHNTIHT